MGANGEEAIERLKSGGQHQGFKANFAHLAFHTAILESVKVSKANTRLLGYRGTSGDGEDALPVRRMPKFEKSSSNKCSVRIGVLCNPGISLGMPWVIACNLTNAKEFPLLSRQHIFLVACIDY
ncbi:hypothetical protein CAPTEDRAFT_212096 [Capitella teleta]|uniref:Uncharacterized protein n=1 Tax=Capitella teleta TaxID=283909 RepID=R7V7N3_CAPTE|nr:hypothetical protein CAPTEDRAFT_212096 [Capitella teleta]|eukprot:ELU12386.1 hypothetical protein CAPTEDRAFT_212096 [Capitella teleta]